MLYEEDGGRGIGGVPIKLYPNISMNSCARVQRSENIIHSTPWRDYIAKSICCVRESFAAYLPMYVGCEIRVYGTDPSTFSALTRSRFHVPPQIVIPDKIIKFSSSECSETVYNIHEVNSYVYRYPRARYVHIVYYHREKCAAVHF